MNQTDQISKPWQGCTPNRWFLVKIRECRRHNNLYNGILPMQYACTECGNTVRKEQSSILCPHCDAGPIQSSCARQHISPLGSRDAGNFMAEQPADQEGQQTPSDSEGSKMEDGEARVFSASALARQFAEQAQSLQVPPAEPQKRCCKPKN